MLRLDRRGFLGLSLLVTMFTMAAGAPVRLPAAEPDLSRGRYLLMAEEPGCPYCARFHREIGEAYRNSPQGTFAPLVRRPMGHPDLARLKTPARYSPTFILLVDGKEVGRITGYPGSDFFWPIADALLAKAGFKPEE
ncbi:MAG TPA: hypothetical protein PK264_18765 [Hyphomicrobiaceae bacterium]|nr:hypothetical protein [Hyphomicrobiaceae bacterium]